MSVLSLITNILCVYFSSCVVISCDGRFVWQLLFDHVRGFVSYELCPVMGLCNHHPWWHRWKTPVLALCNHKIYIRCDSVNCHDLLRSCQPDHKPLVFESTSHSNLITWLQTVTSTHTLVLFLISSDECSLSAIVWGLCVINWTENMRLPRECIMIPYEAISRFSGVLR